jgi:hypothetical protein
MERTMLDKILIDAVERADRCASARTGWASKGELYGVQLAIEKAVNPEGHAPLLLLAADPRVWRAGDGGYESVGENVRGAVEDLVDEAICATAAWRALPDPLVRAVAAG